MKRFPITDDWYGLYQEKWGNNITPESTSHPAKFARGLIRHIYQYLLSENLVSSGDTILDPFGGVGLGAADALANNLSYIGVELERRFVDMGQGCDCTGISKTDWIRFYGRWDKTNYKKGRHWCPQCLSEAKKILPSVPPEPFKQASFFDDSEALSASYIQNSGEIPYTLPHQYLGNIQGKFEQYARDNTRAILLQGDSRKLIEVLQQNGIEAVVTSSPFAGSSGGRGEASRNGIDAALFDRHQGGMVKGLGESNGNLGAMQPKRGDLKAIVTSSPFVDSVGSDDPDKRGGLYRDPKRRGDTNLTGTYGDSDGQIGATSGDTFWSAARLILEQCYLLLPVGGAAVFVCKDFIKAGKRIPFSQQWTELCMAIGFEPCAHFRAWQVKPGPVQRAIVGEDVDHTKEYKSFFRRNSEKKGAPRIDWEDVLIFRKELPNA